MGWITDTFLDLVRAGNSRFGFRAQPTISRIFKLNYRYNKRLYQLTISFIRKPHIFKRVRRKSRSYLLLLSTRPRPSSYPNKVVGSLHREKFFKT